MYVCINNNNKKRENKITNELPPPLKKVTEKRIQHKP